MAFRLRYRLPAVGEVIETERGQAKIISLITYQEIIEDMHSSGALEAEVTRFKTRVGAFLRDASKYFECEVVYPDGQTERLDWSEYCGLMKNAGKKRNPQ